MRRRHILCVFIAFMLLLAIAAMVSNLVGRSRGVDLSGTDPIVLKPATRTFLANIKGRVSLTYFVSSKDKVPANMKDVEPMMRKLLEALHDEAPQTIDISIIDPDLDDKNGAAYASRKAVAPVKLRKVRFDAASEQAVWSALDIACNDYPNAVIPFITMADLPYMQDLIVSNLKMMAQPAPAVIGVSAPEEGFTEIPKVLSTIPLTSAVRVDFEGTAVLPPVLDLFMWIAPRRIEERHLRELERFVDGGRSVVIAGSEHTVQCSQSVGSTSCRVERSPYDFNALVGTFGLVARNEVVIDNPIPQPSATVPFPIHFPASLTDIRSLYGFTIGELHVSSVSALEPDPDLLSRSGFDAQTVATTSSETRLISDVKGVFGQEALRRSFSVPKQPWVIRLTPKDPWRGGVLVVGTASVFSDQFLKSSENSNNLLLKAAAETFTSRDRLARLRIERRLPQPLPPSSEGARLFWRVFIVGAVPLLLIIFGIGKEGARLRLPRGVVWRAPAQRAVAAFVLIVLISALIETSPIAPLSLSASAPSKSDAFVASLLSRLPGPVQAELLISPQKLWPATLKDTERQIRTVLRGLSIPCRVVFPESLSREEQNALVEAGIEPFTIERVENDQTVRSSVWAALRIGTPSLSTSIPQIEPRMLQDLQFLVGAALTRLERAAPGPVIGFVSDVPKLTGAQAFEEYTQMGYTPPEGSNPFGEVGRLLQRYGYQVRALNPKDPSFSGKLDLVVWLQPRAPVELLPRFADYMARGGKAFVALQQYKVKQRQYRGRGYDTVYWPEPQTHRFNEYLKLIGISQMGEKTDGPAEVLMDRNQGRLALDTRVYQRSRYREMLKQEVVRPFLIRAVGGGLSRQSSMTARLGALLYIWGNRFTLDSSKLTELKLSVTTLAQTSSRPWKFMWDGGWIPEPALSAPSQEQYLDGPLPLALEVQGHFPTIIASAGDRHTPLKISESNPSAAQGELILSASSEMFTDTNLYLNGYQHDRFLLNSVAALAYGSEMANLQARPAYPQSFPVQSRALTLSWRLMIVCGVPLILLVYGLWHFNRRRVVRGV